MAACDLNLIDTQDFVSTHSHPKVAAFTARAKFRIGFSFNTQPPEGGCSRKDSIKPRVTGFNTQPPEGGCIFHCGEQCAFRVSTHSHPKVAAHDCASRLCVFLWFQHTATRRWLLINRQIERFNAMFQHTATRRWLRLNVPALLRPRMFQHTATRRWLPSSPLSK